MTRDDCRKRRYRDRIAALLALAGTGRRKRTRKQETRAYRCPACKGWHLTSQPKGRTHAA